MKAETRAKLDELIVDCEKALDKPLLQEGEETEQVLRHFRTLCNDIIQPTMEAFSQVLSEHGHKAWIYNPEASVAQSGHSQNAELLMYVNPKIGTVPTDTSHGEFLVSFSFDTVENKMLARVTEGLNLPYGYSRPFNLHPVGGVTTELVEQELFEMIRYGFDCVRRGISTKQQAAVSV